MDNVLYFPAISFPKTSWANRVLLYWGTIGSIIPVGYVNDPNEELDPYTRSLASSGLLRQVSPRDHLLCDRDFGPQFVQYLSNLGEQELRRRRESRTQGNAGHVEYKGVYLEKLGGIESELLRMGLAYLSGNWAFIEEQTSIEFMTYLALWLSTKVPGKFKPITDKMPYLRKVQCFDRRLSIQTEAGDEEGKRVASIRTGLLKLTLPAPKQLLSPHELLKFKERYAAQLIRFRNYLESAVNHIAFARSAGERQKWILDHKREIQSEREEICARLKESGWMVELGGIAWVVLKKIPVIGGAFDFLEALWPKKAQADLNRPLAYAALAEHRFDKK